MDDFVEGLETVECCAFEKICTRFIDNRLFVLI